MSSSTTANSHITRSSRSNSTSSSVVTVTKTASLSPRSDPRPAQLKGRPTSPEQFGPSLISYLSDQGASRIRPESALDSKGATPNLNINRWSHSTSSSTSAIDTDAVRGRANHKARRMSISSPLPSGTLPGDDFSSIHFQITTSRSPSRSPDRNHGLGTARAERDTSFFHNASPGTQPLPQLTPTSMFNTTAAEYFGETWQHQRTGKHGEPVTAMALHYVRSAPQSSHRPEENSSPQQHASGYPFRPGDVGERENSAPAQEEITVTAGRKQQPTRQRSHRSPTQKTMLANALAKANKAVLLDNAQNFGGAIAAYAEACDLLHQVMVRSSDLDDRKKLSAIRNTYSNRIAELHDLEDPFASLLDKALPEDPPLDDDNAFFSSEGTEPSATDVLETVEIPPRQESLLPQIFGGEQYYDDPSAPAKRNRLQDNLVVPMDTQYMPPPLSPRRPPSPSSATDTTPVATVRPSDGPFNAQHVREPSTESTSWLDTVEDADSSNPSSRLTSVDFGSRKNAQELADEIEAEFDAALNAAVNAAYDNDPTSEDDVTLRERMRYPHDRLETPESIHPDVSVATEIRAHDGSDLDADLTREYSEDEAAEEERLLEEMTQGYVFDDFRFDKQSKSALPRQSDSSSFSGRTWASSVPSTTATNATTLSTLAESHEIPVQRPSKPPTASKEKSVPVQSVTRVPAPATTSSSRSPTQEASRRSSFDRHVGLGLRDRRLSGQSTKQLKIETFVKRNSVAQPPRNNLPAQTMPKVEIPTPVEQQRLPHSAPVEPSRGLPSVSTVATQPITPMTSVHSSDSFPTESPATSARTRGGSGGSPEEAAAAPPVSPTRLAKMMPPPPTVMRKNLSSSSLKLRNLSIATTDTTNESPITPISGSFASDLRQDIPPLPTPSAASFGPRLVQYGGMYLFDDHIGVPATPQTPLTPNALMNHNSSSSGRMPQPLEPCPEAFLLRPFWLMRCLSHALSHPRGGYVTTKLFIPRDIWRVKSTKLRLVDEKVSQCDLLTAALLKLAKADTFDADAVLEELQAFEAVLDQVRSTLQKKLGSDVGLSSSSSLFKSSGTDESDALGGGSGKMTSSSTSTAAKSFASGWRKLRSRSSAAVAGAGQSGHSNKDGGAGLTMPSLPMTSSTSLPTSRTHRSRPHFSPPTPTELADIPLSHATYMSSLARLFDAAQILDGIARQVEDPGLKCSNKTQVGLELGVKNAAEFFAFFVIRFVMTDLMMLVDKFLKRSTEWVLA